MIKLIKHSPQNTGSLTALLELIHYISDTHQSDNAGKEILPAHNYQCADQSQEAFIQRVLDLNTRYFQFRQENRLKGPRIQRLFDHVVYCCPPDTYLTPSEREEIELMIIDILSLNGPVRTVWHTLPNGRSDLHILLSAKAPSPGNPLTLDVVFGSPRGSVVSTFRSCATAIHSLIHSSPTRIP